MEKKPYSIIKSRYVTEKSMVLAGLEKATSNPCVRKCDTPKAVFLVDRRANKQEIAWAIEKIYEKKKVKVIAVNTIQVKPKTRMVRGKLSKTTGFKKAIVTLRPGDQLTEEQG